MWGLCDPTAFCQLLCLYGLIALNKNSNSERKQTRKYKNIFLISLKALIVVILDLAVEDTALKTCSLCYLPYRIVKISF